ncbi:Baseplate J-like protein [Candidatus Nitrososphaera evergladensis SR1]|uniref:Baseplate J-like protein n=1 Tax=Candidatus Nitrososphaera evergladensis SR1 TaxID=1459636 RepID=A0A075MM59_9ARCH|nr:baseplate J/gp47 family protein [Candidatus Nitrososphaera evergladensis]AIF82571.1 Baseplate J-like protein [Candidatus Nitrososphaera evergladensis SR1]
MAEALQFKCGSDARRSAIRDDANLNGVDYLEVRTVHSMAGTFPYPLVILYCFKDVPPAALGAENVVIEGGVRIRGVSAQWVHTATELADNPPGPFRHLVSNEERDKVINKIEDPARAIVIRPSSCGDFSTYELTLKDSPGKPPLGFDPVLSRVRFSFMVECKAEFDCLCKEPSNEVLEEPAIDYMAKDYASFRKLVLDRLTLIMPNWKDRNPADIGMMLAEVIAYVGDHLSYYQDAVATEGYLGTARKRISAARHARLLDYPVNDGRNARAWVCFSVNSPMQLEKGTTLLTKVEGEAAAGAGVFRSIDEEVAKGAEVFETMYKATLYPGKNEMNFYTWGETDCWLPAGAISASIDGAGLESVDVFNWNAVPGADSEKLTGYLENNFGLGWVAKAAITKNSPDTLTMLSAGDKLVIKLDSANGKAVLSVNEEGLYEFAAEKVVAGNDHVIKTSCLQVGDVLVFAQRGSQSGIQDADISRRHAVRLTRLSTAVDPLTGASVLQVSWAREDALPFSLCLASGGKPASLVYGNTVLADHGLTVTENLENRVASGKYYPRLSERPLTMAGPGFDASSREGGSAASAFSYGADQVLPAIELVDKSNDRLTWEPDRDLLSNDEFARVFAVETEVDGISYIRFGESRRKAWALAIRQGKPVQFGATYRIGNGVRGNVGAESITRVVMQNGKLAEEIVAFNPLPAAGGQDPETLASISLHAPQAFRRQERAVTEADYEEVLKRHPQVQQAAAAKRWTGSWYTMFVAIDRKGGQQVDGAFRNEILDFLEKYRLAGYDIEVQPPIYVPLDIAIEVCLKEGHFKGEVKERLVDAFSNRVLPNGSRGFFHPDNFTFGQPVYLSKVYEAALAVDGVQSVVVKSFHRWAKKPNHELEDAAIRTGHMEIIRLDNDPNFAENGIIRFEFCGSGGV